MAQKTIKQVLKLTLDYELESNHITIYYCGICGVIWHLCSKKIIDLDEYLESKYYVIEHMPQDYFHPLFGNNYGWIQGVQKPRIKFLKEHIKLLSE